MKNKTKSGMKKYYVMILTTALAILATANTLTGLSIFESGSSSVEPDYYFENLKTELSGNLQSVSDNLSGVSDVFTYVSYYWLLIVMSAGLLAAKGKD